MKKCGILCPSVVLLKKHILVMSFIGEGRNPAPKLKDAKLSDAEYELAYDQCVQVCLMLFKHLTAPSDCVTLTFTET